MYKNSIWVIILVVVVSLGCQQPQSEELLIWKEFVHELQSGKLENPERYKPFFENLREPNMRTLGSMRDNAVSECFEEIPKIHRVGNLLHYLLPIHWKSTPEAEPSTFCFSLILEDDQWYFRHLENVFIRLDQIRSLPTSDFPDLPIERKLFMRDEFQVSKDVRLFNYLVEKEGKEFALNWFCDGDGFALAAKVWVPFVPAERAFILYLCWDLSNLRGEDITLVTLEDTEAVVRWNNARYFALYMQTGHLRQQIDGEDFAGIFERIWQDRARAGGWALDMRQEGETIVMHFTR